MKRPRNRDSDWREIVATIASYVWAAIVICVGLYVAVEVISQLIERSIQ